MDDGSKSGGYGELIRGTGGILATSHSSRESVVSIITILIPRRQLSSQERQTPRHKRDERKTKKTTLYASNSRQIGQNHAPDLPRRTWFQQQNIQKRFRNQKKKKEAVVKHTLRVTRDDRWTSRGPNRLAEPLTTVPEDNRTSASDDNKNYHFVST